MVTKFFLVSASILLLAVAFHLGAQTARCDNPSEEHVVGVSTIGNMIYVITDSGHVYFSTNNGMKSVWTPMTRVPLPSP